MNGYDVQIIDNGVYQLAMVTILGFKKMEVMKGKGLHPASEESKVIDAADAFAPVEAGAKTYITLMLWKRSGEQWNNNELLPFHKVSISEKNKLAEFEMPDHTKRSFKL